MHGEKPAGESELSPLAPGWLSKEGRDGRLGSPPRAGPLDAPGLL